MCWINNKKTTFLNKLKQKLKLNNLTVINDRIENYLKFKIPQNTVFTARGFASIDKILDYTYETKKRIIFIKRKNCKSWNSRSY